MLCEGEEEGPKLTHTTSLPGVLPGFISMAITTFICMEAFDFSEFAG